MTAYDLIQRLAKFPPDTRVVHGVDWSDDVVLDDCMDVTNAPPTLVLTTTYSQANPVEVAAYPTRVETPA